MASNLRFRLSQQADHDLEAISDYIAADSIDAAIRVLDRLEQTLLLIAAHPEIGVGRPDLAEGIRMFCPQPPASNYIVFYYIAGETVCITDIVHASTDWISHFQSKERGKRI